MSAIVPISWSPYPAPSGGCPGPSYAPFHVAYGYPTTYQCVSDTGAVFTTAFVTNPSCPDGYRADFQAQICVPLSDVQAFDSVGAGAFFGLCFASTVFVYLVSLACGSIIRAVKRA